MSLSVIIQNIINTLRNAEQTHDESANRQARQDLRGMMRSLSSEEICWVETIMYLGRDSDGTAGLDDRYQDLFDRFDGPEIEVNHIVAKAPLADYLEGGLAKLTRDSIDVDSLMTSFASHPLASLEDGSDIHLQAGPPWICDKCCQPIQTMEDGMVVWLSRSSGYQRLGRDIQILHHMTASPLQGNDGCYPNEKQELARDGSILADEHLHDIFCWNGLIRLLALSGDGTLPTDDVNRVIMRIFVPGYEQARPFFQDAINTGVIQQTGPDGYFYQSELQTIIANIHRMQANH